MSQARRPRVLLADDYPRLLVALRRLLEPWCEVVGSVSTGREAVEAVTKLRPDVIVLDLTMPDLNGLEACRQIKQKAPATNVILLTAIDDPDVRMKALQVGASAYVPKQSVADELQRTIQRIFVKHAVPPQTEE